MIAFIPWSSFIFAVLCVLFLTVAVYGAYHSNPNDSQDP